MSYKSTKRILLIDRQNGWRERSAKILREQGFLVDELEDYSGLPPKGDQSLAEHDLIILGCAHFGAEERDLISHFLDQRDHLLVLMTRLTYPSMRAVFLAGASDVVDKPYDPQNLIDIVRHTLNSMNDRRH